jgi:hypothetical protein
MRKLARMANTLKIAESRKVKVMGCRYLLGKVINNGWLKEMEEDDG